MTKRQITIGCDPELFAFKGSTPISVHDLLPGTKYSPCEIPRGAVQVDGVAAEFNIHPAKTRREFVRNITHVGRVLANILKAKDASIVLKAVPSVTFSEEYFASLPPETKALGCEPDYNAYTRQPNPKPETTKPFRTGSGHVHIGWSDVDPASEGYIDQCVTIVKELDFILYRQSLNWDNDETRAELYGQPGSFRFKPYGLEYRVLSNKWLSSERLINFVYDATKATAARVLAGQSFHEKFTKSKISYVEFLQKNRLPIVEDYAK